MVQPRAPEHARILAANSLLNRGWGLPVAQVEHNSNIQIEVREWLSWMRRADIKMVDVTPQDTNSISHQPNDINGLDTNERALKIAAQVAEEDRAVLARLPAPPAGGK